MREGMVYPCYGILFAKGITGFQLSGHEMRVTGTCVPSGVQGRSNFDVNCLTGDRNALWFFLLAICATISLAAQNYNFIRAAAGLSDILRNLSFKMMLRQDGTVH
jgi:ATP-binding cassette subfamily B (MDR/TAP) protein 1